MFKSPCHQAPLDFASADSGLSVDEPPGYGVILAGPDGFIVHTADVLPPTPVGRDAHSTL